MPKHSSQNTDWQIAFKDNRRETSTVEEREQEEGMERGDAGK